MPNLTTQMVSLTYHPDLAASVFQQLESQPWAMLLRSAPTDHPNNRYDILVYQPVVTAETIGKQTRITEPDRETVSHEDPFELLRTLQNKHLPSVPSLPEVPFIGGWLGYFSYDLGRRIETIEPAAKQDLTAADMAVGLYNKALIVDHTLKTAYWVGENLTDLPQPAAISAQTSPFALTSRWEANMTPEQYEHKFNAVQEYLLSGDCYQINLAQRFHGTYTGSEWLAYQKLEQANLAPFSAFIRLQEQAILSVSPERFLRCKDRQVETKPIKGTRPRSENKVQDQAYIDDLRQAEKDQAENLMIVDLLRNDIGRVCVPGSVRVPKLFDVESFPAVHHLVSTVTGTLDESFDEYDLLRACFPGGSITGAPKVRAMQIIEELEPHRRSVYCGSIGYISRCGTMDTSITIRTLITEKQKIYAWAGGGLVADSVCGAEYQETLDKLGKILPILKD